MNALNAALYAKLTGGTALTALLSGTTAVYHLTAPPGATLPYVLFNTQAARTENLDANRREDVFVSVRGIASTSAAQSGSIDAQIDALLHAGSLTVTGYTTLWQRRVEAVEYLERDGSGNSYWHAGGLYQIRLHKD